MFALHSRLSISAVAAWWGRPIGIQVGGRMRLVARLCSHFRSYALRTSGRLLVRARLYEVPSTRVHDWCALVPRGLCFNQSGRCGFVAVYCGLVRLVCCGLARPRLLFTHLGISMIMAEISCNYEVLRGVFTHFEGVDGRSEGNL